MEDESPCFHADYFTHLTFSFFPVMLLVGFVSQKMVAHYFPKKADPKEVEKTKKMLRRRKEILAQAKQAEKETKVAADTTKSAQSDDDMDISH